jgi:hypothetical protein
MTRAWFVALAIGLLGPALLGPASTSARSSASSMTVKLSDRSIPASFAGQLTVDFHGDAASGCASRGLCGYSGTVSWRPSATGMLDVLSYREHGRLRYTLDLEAGNPNSVTGALGGVTTAKVQLSTPGSTPAVSSCLDATSTGESLPLPIRHDRVVFTLADTSPPLLASHCAGPLDSDIIPALPAPALALAAVLHGRRTISLASSRSYSSHGFADTVQSRLSIRLGRPGHATTTSAVPEAGRYHEIFVTYRATVAGSVLERVSGDADPDMCTLIGSCGVFGTLTLIPDIAGGKAAIDAIAPAGRPYQDLLAAVGLSTRGSAKGVEAVGQVSWNGGVLESDLSQGSTSCRDSAPLGPGAITLAAAKGRLEAQYTPGSTFMLRTRCPGPEDAGVQAFATGEIPLTRLAHRTIRLRLTSGASYSDYGYTVRTIPHLTLTLTRVRVSAGVAGVTSSFTGSFFGSTDRRLSLHP